ncbi:aminotransferase, putative [Cryptococcus deneoformans JEC21]|uniref:kynurenine--oxoglutarate transaminase n=2 Tax=Cryptococcus deneoformans TaxID=40410 RepID=Q5KQ79_CRYD1|nr:aminotransferase, putative [Cryptococcus neoformans var. neoformans JEC21]AAW40632.1 aminotransferase, putative [Cryptococcus neoformans var. neoformans JEC21]
MPRISVPAFAKTVSSRLNFTSTRTLLYTRRMSTTPNAVIPQAKRMFDGATHKLDVWSIFTPANVPADCINLGQGFMNWAPPDWIRAESHESMDHDIMSNHYSHPRGRPRLLKAISKHYSPQFENIVARGKDLTNEEILVTSGANCGMFAALTAHCEPGDEVICIEPYFDQYFASIHFQGAKPVFVPLHPPTGKGIKHGGDWTLNIDEFAAAFTPKTKAVIINTPHNPVGKVFTKEELEQIAKVCIEKNVLVLADEVYDCMVYDGNKHFRIATLPGMWERTLTVGSGGKSFACTGWRVGWLIGPPQLTAATLAAHSRIVFCTNSPMQEAVAIGLEKAAEHKFFEEQVAAYEERRDILCSYFDQIGLSYTKPEGSYFLLVDISPVKVPEGYPIVETCKGRGKDFEFCWWLCQELKVVGIPPSEFYSEEHVNIGERFARFAFCKDPELLHAAGKRLLKLKEYL